MKGIPVEKFAMQNFIFTASIKYKFTYTTFLTAEDKQIWHNFISILLCSIIIIKAEFFRNSVMNYRKKITYLGILCKIFHFLIRIWKKYTHFFLIFKVVKYLTTHFGSFRIYPLLAWGVARRDVIIYKIDRVCIIMKEIVTISRYVFRYKCLKIVFSACKLSNVKSKRSHITDVATTWIIR